MRPSIQTRKGEGSPRAITYSGLSFELPDGARDLSQLVYQVELALPQEGRILKPAPRVERASVVIQRLGGGRNPDVMLAVQQEALAHVLPTGSAITRSSAGVVELLSWDGVMASDTIQLQTLALVPVGGQIISVLVTGPRVLGTRLHDLALSVARSFRVA